MILTLTLYLLARDQSWHGTGGERGGGWVDIPRVSHLLVCVVPSIAAKKKTREETEPKRARQSEQKRREEICDVM